MGVSLPASPHVVVRADASSTMGLGHAMRSITLCEALVEHGADCTFMSHGVPVQVLSLLSPEVEQVQVSQEGAAPAEIEHLEPDVVMVDGYHFSQEFFAHLDKADVRYGVIDDNVETNAPNPALILNQNPHATPDMYGAFPNAQLLLGLRYALIRPAVAAAAVGTADRSRNGVLVAMGGSDPAGLTVPITRELSKHGVDIFAVVGPATANAQQVERDLSELDGVSLVAQDQLVSRLAHVELAVIGAGTMMWEAAAFGTPTVAVVVADNQRGPVHAAARLGFLQPVELCDEGSVVGMVSELVGEPNWRVAASRAAVRSVDHRGAQRVSAAVCALQGARCSA